MAVLTRLYSLCSRRVAPYSVVLQGQFRLVFTLLNIRYPIYCGKALGAGHLSTSKNVTPSVSRRCHTAIIFTPISFH
jgi:hypothetical protein